MDILSTRYRIVVIDTGAPKEDNSIEVYSVLNDDGIDNSYYQHGPSVIKEIKN